MEGTFNERAIEEYRDQVEKTLPNDKYSCEKKVCTVISLGQEYQRFLGEESKEQDTIGLTGL